MTQLCSRFPFGGAVVTHITTGLYKSPAAAADAVRALEGLGVTLDEINLVASEDFDRDGIKHATHSKAPEGFMVGAAGGGTVGALVAGLSAASAIATGGASLGLLVAGPVAAALVGGSAGATAGSIVGGMVGAAIPEKEVKYYEDAFKAGSVLVGVESEDAATAEKVKETLEHSGAEKVSHSPSKLVKRLLENDGEAKLPT
jgi:hypothetical protein